MTDEEKEKQANERRRKELLALFLLLLTATRDSLTATVTQFLSGTLTLVSLSDTLVSVLGSAHAQATALGRQMAGVGGAGVTEADEAFAASVMDEQEAYLDGLLKDLGAGRYNAPLIADGAEPGFPAALAQRLKLYAVRLRGTANEAWMLSLPSDTLVEWVLGLPETRHCPTCPARAAHGPYKAADVTFWPGDGQSECGVLCLCQWRTVGGNVFGFPPATI